MANDNLELSVIRNSQPPSPSYSGDESYDYLTVLQAGGVPSCQQQSEDQNDENSIMEIYREFVYGEGNNQSPIKPNIESSNLDNNTTPSAEAMSKAFQDKKHVKKVSDIIKKICDGEPVNVNPLPEIPTSDMRLYSVDDNYFESIDELLEYCRINKKSIDGLNVLDYFRVLAGCTDVIRKSNRYTSMLYTAVDMDGYGIYNNERSIYTGTFIWEYNHGTIRELYKPFRDRGVVFENDIYAKIDASHEQLIRMLKQENIFNIQIPKE